MPQENMDVSPWESDGRDVPINDLLGQAGIPLQVNDGGEGAQCSRLDLHQVLFRHLQNLHQLLQQARVQQRVYIILRDSAGRQGTEQSPPVFLALTHGAL